MQLGLNGFIAATWSCCWFTPWSVLPGLLWSADCTCLGTCCAWNPAGVGLVLSCWTCGIFWVESLHSSSWLQTGARWVLRNGMFFGERLPPESENFAIVPSRFPRDLRCAYLELDWCLVAPNIPKCLSATACFCNWEEAWSYLVGNEEAASCNPSRFEIFLIWIWGFISAEWSNMDEQKGLGCGAIELWVLNKIPIVSWRVKTAWEVHPICYVVFDAQKMKHLGIPKTDVAA